MFGVSLLFGLILGFRYGRTLHGLDGSTEFVPYGKGSQVWFEALLCF